MFARSRYRIFILLAFGCLGWFATGLAKEIDQVARRARRPRPVPPHSWQLGKAQVERLDRILVWAHGEMPPDAKLAFASRSDRSGDGFFRWRWASYLLPERDILPFPGPAAERYADYLLAYGVEMEDPRLEEVGKRGPATLFRIRRPVEDAGKGGSP